MKTDDIKKNSVLENIFLLLDQYNNSKRQVIKDLISYSYNSSLHDIYIIYLMCFGITFYDHIENIKCENIYDSKLVT